MGIEPCRSISRWLHSLLRLSRVSIPLCRPPGPDVRLTRYGSTCRIAVLSRPDESPRPPIAVNYSWFAYMTSFDEQGVAIGAQRAVELQNAEELMKEIIIPPRPTILIEVLNEQSRPDPNLQRIGDLISKDVAISAGVLRVVNSAYFGLPRKVTSIDHAVRMIGLRSVTNIVTALMLHSAFSENRGDFMDSFWSDSETLAAATSFAARTTGKVPTQEAYSLGLFANCGVPLMLRRFPEYATIYDQARSVTDQSVTSYEEAELGTDHTLVGFIMGKNWELPESFCQCILRHHDLVDYYVSPETPLDGIVPYLGVLQLGQHLARTYDGHPPSFEWLEVGDFVLAYLGIRSERLEEITEEGVRYIDSSGGMSDL